MPNNIHYPLMVPFALLFALISVPWSIISVPTAMNEYMVGRSELQTSAGSELEYAIITTSALKDGFGPLIEWRLRTGLSSEMFLLDGESGILKGPGRDDAERLFNFIGALRSSSNDNLRYVLLGGDSDVVPVRYLHAGASEWEMDESYLSDVYYSSPTTDWDRDGDGLYGEKDDIVTGDGVDLSFDIVVGRVPANTVEEANRFSQRLISYEQRPQPGPWTSRFVMASSLMDRPNVLNDPNTVEDEGYDPYKDNGYKAIMNHTLQFIPRSLDIIDVDDHPFYEGMVYSEANDSLDFNTLPELISTGCALFTFAGQSFYDVDHPVTPPLAYSLAQYIDPQGLARGGAGFGEALTYEDALGLDNGDMLPVIYLSSCDSANFSDPLDRDLSNMVLAPNGGAICLIGSSGVSWRGEGVDYSLGNWYLMSRFWQQFMGTNRPGEALYDLKSHYLSSKWDEQATKEPLLVGMYAYNLIGDPATSSWVGGPLNIGWVGAPETVRAGGEHLKVEVRTTSDVPLYDATVSVSLPDTGEVFKGRTGPDGKVEIMTEFGKSGNAVICVRARNHIPFFQNITVLPRPPDLEVLNGTFQIGPAPLSEGKGAGVRAIVRNNGSSDIIGAKVGVFTGQLGQDPGNWPEPIISSRFDIRSGSFVVCSFNVTPDRSWKRVTIAAYPVEGELDISNNFVAEDCSVNARPRFMTLPLLEALEDSPGGAEMPLGAHVFDPDDKVEDLEFALLEGTPDWVFVKGQGNLVASPPENWSGTLRVKVQVWDGLAGDTASLQISITPVNDAPIILGLPGKVNALTGQVFVLPLDIRDAEGDEVEVTIGPEMNGLTVSGRSLRLLSSEQDLGLHSMNLSVKDIYGATNNYSMVIEIKIEGAPLYFDEPSLHLPPAREGSRYSYKVKIGGALSSGALFQDNTSLFDIEGSTGRISFTPRDEDVGEHWTRISATSGNVTISRTFILEVREAPSGPSALVIGLVGALGLMVALLIAVILWRGPRVGQYGVEE
ncbi:MAG: C25 family cysteine peptidase [Candidatus Thermoplasmatota archaeon]|jgi:hypothetical protein|nr:C25 family cysteine peptidase [Candidatus Thermoplasmatota archaeon]